MKHLLGLIGISLAVLAAGCIGTEKTGVEKMEETIEQQEFDSNILKFEQRFSKNSNQGDMEADSQVEFIKGKNNSRVLISAPHTTAHVREGKVKPAEIYTGSMAHLLQEYTGAHLIINTYKGEDANYVEGGKYKEKIGEVIEEYDIDLIIDLHGAERERDFNLDIGTADGKTVRNNWVENLKAVFQDNGIEHVYENHTFTANHKGSVTHHTWKHYGTEAMQLEINRRFRDPKNNLEEYYKMLKSLTLFVEKIHEEE
jgi:hypothetical protein